MNKIFQKTGMIFICVVLIALPRFNRNQLWLERPQADMAIHSAMVDYFRTGNIQEILLSKDSIAANWRPLFPFMASWLPFSPITSLSIIGILSIFFSAMLLKKIIMRLKISNQNMWRCIYLFVISFPTFYYTTIGYVDPGLILFITLGIYLILLKKIPLFLLLFGFGVLMKEGIIVLIPFYIFYVWSNNKSKKNIFFKFGIICFIYLTVSYFIREFSLNAAEGHTLFWQPSFDMLFYNFNRPNSWLSLILTLGIPGMIVLKNASNLKQIILSHSMALPLIFGIIFSLITYLFAFISTVADGRTVWAAYPFLIPLVGYILDNRRSLAIRDE